MSGTPVGAEGSWRKTTKHREADDVLEELCSSMGIALQAQEMKGLAEAKTLNLSLW